MYKTADETLFMGKNIVFVPECPSTNDLAMKLLQQSSAIEGTVVITDCQTAGKGQRGNTWESEPSQNLTFSVLLKPTFLAIKDQFMLSIATCLAVHDYLIKHSEAAIQVKWPNDVLANGKKIGGILIENQIQGNTLSSSVIGIGLNIGQLHFSMATATSLALVTGRSYELVNELPTLLATLEARYMQLRQGSHSNLLTDYLDALYLLGERHQFKTKDELFEGIILGIDATGKLMVKTAQGVRFFAVKEIAYG